MAEAWQGSTSLLPQPLYCAHLVQRRNPFLYLLHLLGALDSLNRSGRRAVLSTKTSNKLSISLLRVRTNEYVTELVMER